MTSIIKQKISKHVLAKLGFIQKETKRDTYMPTYSCTYHIILAYSCTYQTMLAYSCMHKSFKCLKKKNSLHVLIIMHHEHAS